MVRLLLILLLSGATARAQFGKAMLLRPLTATGLAGADADAQAYFNRVAAAGVTLSTSQQTAVNTFIVGLKSNGLYSSIYDMGLILGGTANTHAVTFKNVAPATAWISPAGITHSSTGIAFNSSAAGNTGIIPSASLSLNSLHVAVYNRTNVTQGNKTLMGAQTGSGFIINMIPNLGSLFYIAVNTTNSFLTGSNTTTAGLYIASRTASNAVAGYKNGTAVITGTAASTGLPTVPLYLSARDIDNLPQFQFNGSEISFWSVGAGLSSTDVATFSTLVNNLQTALGRNIY